MADVPEFIVQVQNTLDVPATISLSPNGPTNQVNSGQWLQYGASTPFTTLQITAPQSNTHAPLRFTTNLNTTSFQQGCFTITPTAVVRSSVCGIGPGPLPGPTPSPTPYPGPVPSPTPGPEPGPTAYPNGGFGGSQWNRAPGSVTPQRPSFWPQQPQPPSPQPTPQQQDFYCTAMAQPDGTFNLMCRPSSNSTVTTPTYGSNAQAYASSVPQAAPGSFGAAARSPTGAVFGFMETSGATNNNGRSYAAYPNSSSGFTTY